MKRLLLALLASLPVASVSFATQVFTVGPPGSGASFNDIQSAIDAASPGDVVLVAPGTYQAFILDKPLHVQGAGPGATVIETPQFGAATMAIVLGVPAGQTAVVAGMSAVIGGVPLFRDGLLVVEPLAGTVALHDLNLVTHPGAGTVFATGVGRLIVSSSLVHGGAGGTGSGPGYALESNDSRVWVVDSVISGQGFPGFFGGEHTTVGLFNSAACFAVSAVLGGDVWPTFGGEGGDGIDAQSSTLFFDRSIVQGGVGTTSTGAFAMLLASNTTATARADSVVVAGPGGGGVPVSADPSSQFTVDPAIRPTLSASVPLASA